MDTFTTKRPETRNIFYIGTSIPTKTTTDESKLVMYQLTNSIITLRLTEILFEELMSLDDVVNGDSIMGIGLVCHCPRPSRDVQLTLFDQSAGNNNIQ